MWRMGRVYSGAYAEKNTRNITPLNPLRYLSSFGPGVITAAFHAEQVTGGICVSQLCSHQEWKCNQRHFFPRRKAEIFILGVPKSFPFCRILHSDHMKQLSFGWVSFCQLGRLTALIFLPLFSCFQVSITWDFSLIPGFYGTTYQDLCSLLIANILTHMWTTSMSSNYPKRVLAANTVNQLHSLLLSLINKNPSTVAPRGGTCFKSRIIRRYSPVDTQH